MDVAPRSVRVKRADLVANGFLPDCAPFSERWMSALDNSLSKSELGVSYTALEDYLAELVAHYEAHPQPPPLTYRRRRAELQLAERLSVGADA